MQQSNKKKFLLLILLVTLGVLFLSILAIVFGQQIVTVDHVPGIRIAALILTFVSFLSSTILSLLVYMHNKTVLKINEDTNHRAELARDSQFVASNYSIIEFMDRMLIYKESTRYIQKYVLNGGFEFHMAERSIDVSKVTENPEDYQFLSARIPFRVVEGKMVSKITFRRFKFSRHGKEFNFENINGLKETRAYILYNEFTKRHNIILNIIVKKEDGFYDPESINVFSKIKLRIKITSLLNVSVVGISELYFSNPEQKEGDGSNTYRINSSNFVILEQPFIDHYEND